MAFSHAPRVPSPRGHFVRRPTRRRADLRHPEVAWSYRRRPGDRMRFSDRIDTDPLAFSILFALLCEDDKALRQEGAPVRTLVSGQVRRGQTDGWMDPPFGS